MSGSQGQYFLFLCPPKLSVILFQGEGHQYPVGLVQVYISSLLYSGVMTVLMYHILFCWLLYGQRRLILLRIGGVSEVIFGKGCLLPAEFPLHRYITEAYLRHLSACGRLPSHYSKLNLPNFDRSCLFEAPYGKHWVEIWLLLGVLG